MTKIFFVYFLDFLFSSHVEHNKCFGKITKFWAAAFISIPYKIIVLDSSKFQIQRTLMSLLKNRQSFCPGTKLQIFIISSTSFSIIQDRFHSGQMTPAVSREMHGWKCFFTLYLVKSRICENVHISLKYVFMFKTFSFFLISEQNCFAHFFSCWNLKQTW